MIQDNEQVNVEFHNQAKEIFLSILNEFRQSVSSTSRTHNEYLFQQLKEQHVKTFKQRLEMIANQLIRKHQHSHELNRLNQNFGQFIKDYLHQFVQETKRI
ncbi:MAG TPA: hypothetical protein VGC29_08690 [Flavisolibacter sp.]